MIIPFERAAQESRKDSTYAKRLGELDDEFELAEELIKARLAAKMTQEQVARAMGTSQSAVYRIESGRGSLRSIKKYAKATGKKVVIKLV